MLQSDLFAVTALPPAPAMTGLLPLRVVPQSGEALASWITRLSAALRLSPLALGRIAFGVDATADPDWWRRPSTEVLALIAEKTGVSTRDLAAMTFRDWGIARDDEAAQRIGSKYHFGSHRSRRDRRIGICPRCLADDRSGYLRLLWMNGWAGVCPEHRIVLTGHCPSCRCVLRVPGLNTRQPVDLTICRKCGLKLAGTIGVLAPPSALCLQAILVAGKELNRTRLPGGSTLDWPTTMALIDVLLSMVWIDIPRKYRERLFVRIAKDLDLGEHNNIVWSSNYGGLLILAWLLEDLAKRLSAAIAILHAPRLDRLLARVPDLSAEMSDLLRVILAPAIASSPKGRRSWCNWIETLPEAGIDLRERALRERYKLRRQRLFAFAAVHDGAMVEAAAESVGVTARTLYRWLLKGAEHGLEAALERPRRQSQLTGAQAEALGRWIAADRAHQHRPVVIAEAMAQFGIALSPDHASALLRVHRRAKPGRRHRRWKPKPRKLTQVAGPTHDPAPGL
ncbi:transposase [Bradyrhizobium sp. i1.8.4]|uniref:TniQ family protein n=1 Tax=unclassified Bradyrhizobium TaxID=2631580 RepID=UPI003D20D171